MDKIERISIRNSEFEGDNNAYLLRSEKNILIDTAISLPQAREELEKGLKEHGVNFDDIDEVFLTHWHADHAGLAGEIQSESGCTVHVHSEDADLVRQTDEALEEVDRLSKSFMRDWGAPEDKVEELYAFLEASSEVSGASADVDSFEDGDVFEFTDFSLEIVHAPGHAAGMSCFVFHSEDDEGEGVGEDGEVVFSGDALLPVYTPNVGGSDLRVEKPLEKYLDTLRKIINRDFDVAYPGHRDPIDAPAERVKEIIDHHRKRARKIVELLLDDDPLSVWEVSDALFGELENIHIIHGPGEAYAHPEHLERQGIVEKRDKGYVISEPLESDSELEKLLDTPRTGF